MVTYTRTGVAKPVVAYENVDTVSVFGPLRSKNYPAGSDVIDMAFTPSGDLIIFDGTSLVRWERVGSR